MNVVLIVLLILLLFGGAGTLPLYGYSAGWGYMPSTVIWLVLVVLLVLFLMGRV